MKELQAQNEVFKAMLSGERVRKFTIDENKMFITPNGTYGFIFNVNSLQINEQRISEMHKIDMLSVVSDENECKLTNEMLLSNWGRRVLRKLKRGKEPIYINNSLLKW